MFRAEIIANHSVQDELIEELEKAIPDVLYTVIPEVQGRGGNNRKLGTVTWPEVNFALFAYVSDGDAPTVRAVIADIKERFPNEGIKLFMVRAEE
jgi:hypothetical protein